MTASVFMTARSVRNAGKVNFNSLFITHYSRKINQTTLTNLAPKSRMTLEMPFETFINPTLVK